MIRPVSLIVLMAVSVTAGPAVGVQPTATPELRTLQAEYRDELIRARRLRAEAQAAQIEIGRLDAELTRLGREGRAEDLRLTAQRARLDELGRREAGLLAELSRERGAQGRLLSALQMMSRDPPPPLLIPADKAVDTVRASILLKAMAPTLEARAQAVVSRQNEVRRVRRLAALSAERLFTTESAQSDRLAEIESLTRRKRALTSVLRADAQRAERFARALEARIQALGAVPGRLEADEGRVPVARLPAGRERLTPPVGAAPMGRYRADSPGWRWSGAGPVRAPAQAVVDHAGPLAGWGQVVILDLGPGWKGVVAGLDALEVSDGDRVADGQVLGRSGADAEVYFELRREGRPVDPAPWLR